MRLLGRDVISLLPLNRECAFLWNVDTYLPNYTASHPKDNNLSNRCDHKLWPQRELSLNFLPPTSTYTRLSVQFPLFTCSSWSSFENFHLCLLFWSAWPQPKGRILQPVSKDDSNVQRDPSVCEGRITSSESHTASYTMGCFPGDMYPVTSHLHPVPRVLFRGTKDPMSLPKSKNKNIVNIYWRKKGKGKVSFLSTPWRHRREV